MTAAQQDQAPMATPGCREGETYDVVVLGAGPVGQNVADRARAGGLRVAVVERELVGGECSYWACVPSKALLRPVIAISDARRVDGAREAVDGSINTAGVFGRRNRYVAHWDDTGQADWVSGIGATLIRGDGRLDGPRRVVVTKSSGESVALTARHAVVICTGSRPALPDLPGITEARPWTNRQATDNSTVPDRLAIVGAGGVGVEMATAWQGLGASVTLLARGSGLLPCPEWNRLWGNSSVADWPTPALTCAWEYRYARWAAPTQLAQWSSSWTTVPSCGSTRYSSPPAEHREPTTSAWRQ